MRQYRIGMTDIERAHHKPGTGALGSPLNLTVSLADVWGVTLGSSQPTSRGHRKPKYRPVRYAGYARKQYVRGTK